MRKFQKITSLLILLIIISSCEKKTTELEFEKSVMSEIFPSLINSTCIDSRILFLPPPLGKPIYDKNDNYIGSDTSNIKTERENWERKIAKIKKDTSKIVVAIDDTIYRIEKKDQIKLTEYYKNAIIVADTNNERKEYKIDLKKQKYNQKFKLKYLSEFPKKDTIWKTKYSFNFSGIVSFSRIQFDKEKKYGILSAGFVCGRLCGQGFRIFIKKVNNKWIIDKTEGTWIS